MAVKFENSEELFSTQIGNIGLTAAAFDYFGLAEVIELCAGKTGSHVKVKQSEVVKLMCCQVLNVPYQYPPFSSLKKKTFLNAPFDF